MKDDEKCNKNSLKKKSVKNFVTWIYQHRKKKQEKYFKQEMIQLDSSGYKNADSESNSAPDEG